jgi:membrane associated rhomboid family serine protease
LSRRPTRFPIATIFIIAVNGFVLFLEMMAGDTFVLNWAAVPAHIVSGHRWTNQV